MGAGHVPELCYAVLDPTFGSMYVRGPSVLTQCGKDLRAAKAVVAFMFSQRFLSDWRNLFVLDPKYTDGVCMAHTDGLCMAQYFAPISCCS